MDYRKTTAVCGMDCFNCPLFKDNINDSVRKRMAHLVSGDPHTFACGGCRETGCILSHVECATLKCAQEKGHWFCSDCDSFPCQRLAPCADQAERLPHNYKLYALSTIRSRGVEAWGKEAAGVRALYYRGKMVIGAGPSLDEDI